MYFLGCHMNTAVTDLDASYGLSGGPCKEHALTHVTLRQVQKIR